MTFLDFFAGVGTIRIGFEQAGWTCNGHVEWDKFAQASYNAMHDIKEGEFCGWDIREVRADELPQSDLWTFGAPCQDFSIAGKRKGMDGERSSLIREIFRLIEETKEENRPTWLLYENVKGMLSSNGGRDFLGIITEMAELGYDVEWQNINSKNWGVPQNRERVFVVGHRRDVKTGNIFPLERIEINGCEIEKVYSLSEGISRDEGLFQGISSGRKEVFRTSLQRLFKKIQQELQTGESREIQEVGEEARQVTEGSLQEIKAEFQRSQGLDYAGEVCGVVSIPTEEMLLLWARGEQTSNSEGCIQQQDLQTINRQNRFISRLRGGEFSSLLLAVQSYQGRLFYSIGDGRDWTKIYSKEVGRWNKTLSSILEDEVDEKYFLSQDKVDRLTKR